MAAARYIGGEYADLTVGDLASRSRVLAPHTARCLALLEKTFDPLRGSNIDDQNCILGRKAFDDIAPHDVAQRIRVPSATTQYGLLTPWARITCRLCAHPPGLAPLIPEQAVKEQARRRRYPFLREQGSNARFDIPQRRRPKLQRRLDRCTRHPRPPESWLPIDSEINRNRNYNAKETRPTQRRMPETTAAAAPSFQWYCRPLPSRRTGRSASPCAAALSVDPRM